MNAEQARMAIAEWKKWGPYVTDRQWGTVREDYSAKGNAWEFISHEMARSKAFRWGEEGIGGICDDKQFLCFALAFWKTDPHFKDYILFYEYFHGDTGRGVGASHQTGWTALIARLLFPMQNEEKWKYRN